MKAMVLAAGRGKRMQPLTDKLPKPLLTVNDKPLIIYHLEKLAQCGITEIVINHAWLGEKIEHALGRGQRWGVNISYSAETEGGLETAGGIINALPLLGDAPFLLINGDVWTDMDYGLLPRTLKPGDVGHLLMTANPPHHPSGDFGIDGDRLCHAGTAQQTRTYTGIGLFAPQWFSGRPVEKLPLRPLFEEAINSQSMAASMLPAKQWWDVGTPQRLAQLDNYLRGLHDLG